jgi:hypothetical protein
MTKHIHSMDIMKDDVYIEYTNGENEYISFSKAKKTIKLLIPKKINFFCLDSERSVHFLNSLLNQYNISHNKLILK